MLKFADLLEKNIDRLADLESRSVSITLSINKRRLTMDRWGNLFPLRSS